MLASLLEFWRVDPEQPDPGPPSTAGPLALAIHDQRVAVRHAYRAGNIGMSGHVNQQEQTNEENTVDHTVMLSRGACSPSVMKISQVKLCSFDGLLHREYFLAHILFEAVDAGEIEKAMSVSDFKNLRPFID